MMSADHLKKSELKSIWQFTIIEIRLPFFKLPNHCQIRNITLHSICRALNLKLGNLSANLQ